MLVAIGIPVHNLAKGSRSDRRSRSAATLGTFLIVGFMIHNVPGIGIAAPAARGVTMSFGRAAGAAVIAGAPTIAGAWIGGFTGCDLLGVLFFAAAAGAAFQVVDRGRALRRPYGRRAG